MKPDSHHHVSVEHMITKLAAVGSFMSSHYSIAVSSGEDYGGTRVQVVVTHSLYSMRPDTLEVRFWVPGRDVNCATVVKVTPARVDRDSLQTLAPVYLLVSVVHGAISAQRTPLGAISFAESYMAAARCAAVFESLVGSFSFQYREKEGVE